MSLNRMVAAALVAVGLGGLSNAALGADMSIKMPVKAVTDPAPYNWTGFYVGVQGGYGWGTGSVNLSPIETFFYPPVLADGEIPASSSLSSKGFLGGVEGGYNYQYGRAVLGVEADFSYSAIRGSNTNVSNPTSPAQPIIITDEDKKLEWFGTVRGRLGLLPAPSMLAYVTGGLAYGKTVASTTTTAINPGPGGLSECPLNGYCSTGSTSSVRAGWTLGAGFEAFVARNWSVKAEYLYYDLGHASYTNIAPTEIPPTVMQTDVHFNGSIARVGLNYQFN